MSEQDSSEKKESKKAAKKVKPTNCAATNARIRRKDWYYRNGKYYANKRVAKEHILKLRKESEEAKAKRDAEAKAKEEAEAKAKPETRQTSDDPKSSGPPPVDDASGESQPASQ